MVKARSRYDSELSAQVKECQPYFKEDDFDRFIRAQARFDKKPVHVGRYADRPFSEQEFDIVYNYHLRKMLQIIPAYMQTVNQSGLKYGQGISLLMHMLNGDKYDFTNKESDLTIMTKALTVARDDSTLPQSVNKIKKLMSAGVGGSGMGGTLYSFYLTSRLGVPIVDVAERIAKGAEGSYVMGPFNEAIKSMLPAKPNPQLVVEALRILDGDGANYWNAGGYKQFEELMTFAAPGIGISIDNMLAMFVSGAKSKSKRKQLQDAIDKKDNLPSKENYFIQYDGELEPLAQPFVSRRSFKDGVKDLENVANARYSDWKEVGEGMFAFDPNANLWYSLGGKLELPSMEEVLSRKAERVRHHFLPYDISNLSETPFLFHVHPRELSIFVSPDRDSLICPQLQQPITKFLTATPSRADYKVVAQLIKEAKKEVKPRAFIAHTLGVTEFTFPYDVKAIEFMGEKARDLRDQPLLNFRHELLSLEEPQFVEALIQDFNSHLPQGFEIKLNQLKF